MSPHIEIDKATNVAYFDVCDPAGERSDAKVRVFSVSDRLGLRSQVYARMDAERGEFLGIIIEDYKAFSTEIRRKYLAWRVERLVGLIICMVRSIVARQESDERARLIEAH